jgi:hypothetical protein
MTDDSKQSLEQTKNEIDEILRRVDSLLILGSRTADEVVGYDEHGMPSLRSANLLTTERRPLPDR